MNELVLNVETTKRIVLGNRHVLASATALSLSVDSKSVQQVTEAKLLGVKIDNLLSWSEQIDHIMTKMGMGIAISRKCSGFVPPLVVKDVIRPLVLSHIEYCPLIWSSAAEKHL